MTHGRQKIGCGLVCEFSTDFVFQQPSLNLFACSYEMQQRHGLVARNIAVTDTDLVVTNVVRPRGCVPFQLGSGPVRGPVQYLKVHSIFPYPARVAYCRTAELADIASTRFLLAALRVDLTLLCCAEFTLQYTSCFLHQAIDCGATL